MLAPLPPATARSRFVVRSVRLDHRTLARFVGSRADPGESTMGVRLYRLRHGAWTASTPMAYVPSLGFPDRYRVVRMDRRGYRLVIGDVFTMENVFCSVLLFDVRRNALYPLAKGLLNVDDSKARTGAIREDANAKWVDRTLMHERVERIWRVEPICRSMRAGAWHGYGPSLGPRGRA